MQVPAEITTRGGALRWARAQRGWNQAGLARAVGVASSSLSNIEAGHEAGSAGLLSRLAAELGVEPHEFTSRPKGSDGERIYVSPEARERKRARDAQPRCGLCRKLDHNSSACPLRARPRKHFCPVCYGLPHRRPQGDLCLCLGRYEAEPGPALSLDGVLRSSGGMCLDAAPGGEDEAAA